MPPTVERRLADGLSALGMSDVPGSRIEALLAYLDLLTRWNSAYNLTAVRQPEEMVTRHLLDSLSVLPFTSEGLLLDVGTGAGLPGIPLAIMQPDRDVVLLDSAGKKIRFLNHVVRQLRLDRVRPVQARLETWRTAEPVADVISRAFARIEDFARASAHLAHDGTRLLAMKGKRPMEELEAVEAPWELEAVHELLVPGLHEQRHLVIMSYNP